MGCHSQATWVKGGTSEWVTPGTQRSGTAWDGEGPKEQQLLSAGLGPQGTTCLSFNEMILI